MAQRTPRRTAVKRTPYKPKAAAKAAPEEVASENEENREKEGLSLPLIKYYREKEKKRDAYIEQLKAENDFLRNINSSVLDYHKHTGLVINKVGEDEYHCTHSLDGPGGQAALAFSLLLGEGMYTYKYIDSNVSDLPEYLTKEIFFEEDQVQLFFFNVYECIIKRK